MLAALLVAGAIALGAGAAGPGDRIAVARPDAGIELISPAGRRLGVLTRHRGWADSDPAWSPDGRRLAFARTTDEFRSFQVWVVRADGRGARRITRGQFDWRPAWSPDGKLVAYQSTTGIRVVRPDGTGMRRVPTLDEAAAYPSWTPAGRIAYAWHAEDPGDRPARCRRAGARCGWVWTSRLDGHDRRSLVEGRDAHWSPDGRTVVFTPPDGGVATVPAAGGRARLLGRGYEPGWSPDGSRIAYSRMGATAASDSTWLMNRDGSGARRIARGLSEPDWRPR